MILLVAVEVGAFLLTYWYLDFLPLWAFCWFFFGFGAIALLGASLMLPLFAPYQEKKDEGSGEDQESLEELEEMDGV